MRQVDFYEFAGVIAPGVTVLLAAALIWPERLGNIQKLDLSLGGFGFTLLVILRPVKKYENFSPV